MNYRPPPYTSSSDRRQPQKLFSAQNHSNMLMSYPLTFASFVPAPDTRTIQDLMAARVAMMAPTFPASTSSRGINPTVFPKNDVSSSHGLELLRAASLQVPNKPLPPKLSATSSSSQVDHESKTKPKKEHNTMYTYIDKIRDSDILCGRGTQIKCNSRKMKL